MNKRLILFVLALAVVSLACNAISGQPSAPSLNDPIDTALPAPNILFSDDFGSNASGWEEFSSDDGSAGYSNGAYFVNAATKGNIMWGLSGSTFENTTVEVETTQLLGPANDNTSFGVGCRFTSGDNPSGYLLRISADGYYAIQAVNNGSPTDIVTWTASSAINKGNGEVNRLRATCNGSTLTLEVNGEEVDSVTDSTYSSGYLALAASTFEDTPVQVNFDNLTVLKP